MRLYVYLIFLLILINVVNATQVDKEIEQELTKNNEVEVIVYLKEQKGTSKYINYEYVEENIRKNSIKSLQNDFELEYEYGSINGFSGNITESGLKKLKKNPNIESIYLSKTRKIFLQDSLSLINASLVHSKLINNLNLTGKGQTICILDTGINYSHNDFGSCNSTGNGCRVIDGYDYVNNDNDPYDDNGHGTHVAGIAAASGNITGVAPEANLTIIKVCNDDGDCSDADIISGIEWCNNNRTKFNINIISMSLGGGSSSNYCNDDSLAPSINTAVGNNITVTIAAGNDGSTSEIAAPACVENATSVASSTKQYSFSSFSNRNNITDVVAPGSSINSTSMDLNYEILDGTSMATPHVAGIIALLQQYKKEESNRALTQAEVETALKTTYINITDTTGLNYSFVDTLKALISIDIKKPYFNTLIIPNPANLSENNVTINFSAIDTNLEDVIVNVTYPNGTFLTTSSDNFTLLTTNLTVIGDYNITFYANDSNSNVNQTVLKLTVNNLTTDNSPIVTLNSPSNYINMSLTSIDFNCSATDDINLANLTLYINITGNFTANQTNNITGISNFTIFNLSFTDAIIIWNCLAYDNSSNSAFASTNFTLTIDTLKPIITDITSNSITSSSAVITWTTNEIANSTIYFGDTIETSSTNSNNNFLTSHSISLSSLSPSTIYYYNVSSCDLINNCNTSMQFNFTTSASPESGSGGTGGGGGGAGGGGTTESPPQETQETQETTPVPPTDLESNLSETTQRGVSEGNESGEGNLTQITGEVVREQPNLFKKLLDIITIKTTLTGKVIETQRERANYIAGLVTILSIIALIIYRLFFKISS